MQKIKLFLSKFTKLELVGIVVIFYTILSFIFGPTTYNYKKDIRELTESNEKLTEKLENVQEGLYVTMMNDER